MPESNDDLKIKPSASHRDSLRASLDELAANVDSLVDGLLGDAPDEAPTPLPPLAAATVPDPTKEPPETTASARPEPVATPAPKKKDEAGEEPAANEELRDLADDMVDSLTATPESTDAVVPWGAKDQPIPSGTRRRSYGWMPALSIVVGVVALAAWLLVPDRTPPSATVADDLTAPSDATDGTAFTRQAQIAPVPEALSPRDLSDLPVVSEWSRATPAATSSPEEPASTTTDDVAETTPKPVPKPVTETTAKAATKTKPEKTTDTVAETTPKPVPKPVAETTPKAQPVNTTAAVTPPKPLPERAEPEPSLSRNAAVARPAAKTAPPPPEPEPEPEPVVTVANPVVRPRPEPPATNSVRLPEPIPTAPDATAPAGTTGPAPVSQPPRLLAREEPVYSAQARKRGESGIVELRVLVNTQGRVVRVVVEQGIEGSELEARAIDAALRSTYAPALERGETAEAWVTERFVFSP